jgi:inhibitor of nuclear factor kappa-B kinase subunit alpha
MIDIKIEELRPALIWLNKRQGMGKEKIAELFGISKITVIEAVRRYEEQGDFDDRPRSGRPVTVATEAHQGEMETALKEDPHTRTHSTRKLAAKMRVSQTTVQRMMKKGGYRAWKDQKRQLLTEDTKRQRRERCLQLGARFCIGLHRYILFTDEKYFTVEQAHNRQNDRVWSRGAPSKANRAVARAVKPKGVMVWLGVMYGDKTRLIFVPHGVKVNGEVYVEMLEREVLTWIEERKDDIPFVFQQDGAPAHRKKTTQEWLKERFEIIAKDEWPASSPDLNPLDYSIWSILERDVCAVAHKSVGSLINALQRAADNLDQETINRAIDDFPRRVQACYDAKGGYFE